MQKALIKVLVLVLPFAKRSWKCMVDLLPLRARLLTDAHSIAIFRNMINEAVRGKGRCLAFEAICVGLSRHRPTIADRLCARKIAIFFSDLASAIFI